MAQQYREVEPGEFSSNIAVDVILTIITLGIYGLFWKYRQMRALNTFLGREQFNFWLWILLSIVTCMIWHFFIQYSMGKAICTVNARLGRPVSDSLPVISVLVTLFGFGIVVDAIHQNEINEFFYDD